MQSMNLTASGAVTTGRVRALSLSISYDANGSVTLRNGGASGATVYKFNAPNVAGSTTVNFPKDGFLCVDGIYLSLTNTKATVIYE